MRIDGNHGIYVVGADGVVEIIYKGAAYSAFYCDLLERSQAMLAAAR